ncbi:class I SAM-dependent methyltransferase [Staphylococcus condimenti]|uniref:Class I SAM-dependent methyltransferase n=1 Tax=Staphylococcus condimenti TaxID=70255 RepID=A0A143PAT0_9STAP|nr:MULTISPECIES: class I SAM-dependent methyltransferase [Staphylococcus]AMY05641.1 methyltransferase [Staphylococcus condimenti]APR61847.1 methyltransferase [Staphylococcus condimenti]MDK8645614.1 class I SAM-dependent methyltransferase [Staphylococcus condimenti]OFP00683.1 methyltransferase [Staphylococcus sp. HMSC065E08]PNZ63970.1 class I SAM-dependent methyltransferase [Staphylococcus condimenti]
MSHYYDKDPEVASQREDFKYRYQQNELKLATDSGVFSKGKIDYGSDLLLRTFLKEHPPGPSKTIIDVGCGYGPIGLMIAKVSPHHKVILLDVNHRALDLAKENSEKNHIDNAVIKESDGLAEIPDDSADMIVTNPPIRAGKSVVHGILEDAYSKLKKDGELYVVIQKKQGMPSAKKKMETVFGNVETLVKDKGYYILKSKR